MEQPSSFTPGYHRAMLLVIAAVIVGAFLLQVHPNGRVGLAWLPQVLLPPLCMSRELFSVPCPGCGLTRSFVHLAHGAWQEAWATHRLGWLLALLCVLQVPYRLIAMRRPDWGLLSSGMRNAIGYGVVGLLVGNWVLAILLGV